MERYRGRLLLLVLAILCVAAGWVTLRVTAEYPELGEEVCYEVNEVDGFELTITPPGWSPFLGYSFHYRISVDSPVVYELKESPGRSFENLEVCVDGRWYRLACTDELIFDTVFTLGGEGNTGFEGSVVQKYAGYGTRLEPGLYRLTMELTAADGSLHYLAAEFTVE